MQTTTQCSYLNRPAEEIDEEKTDVVVVIVDESIATVVLGEIERSTDRVDATAAEIVADV